ncbi:MAG: nucleoside hydrolase [Verrucomicrobiales bacterium]|nr:nucleoside hydrolase [Verrucomicrobiales bacterium]
MHRLLLLPLLTGLLTAAEPVRLIFDTDLGNDCDDVTALAMIHALADRGQVNLLAVTVTKDDALAAPLVDAINTFYGRPDTPIGVVRDGVSSGEGRYLPMARDTLPDGSLMYPRDLESNAAAPAALDLLRQTLAAQPDGSVTLCQVGFFTNFARLLDTPPDAHSPLKGRDLIAQKVKLLCIMAGAFQSIDYNGRFTNRHLEYNVVKDIPAAQKLAQEWPTPVVWSGFEIGIATAYPHQSIEHDFDYVPHHPVKDASVRYNPPPHDRPNWDPTAALYAILPEREYFGLTPEGAVDVDDEGATEFKTKGKNQPIGNHRALLLTPTQAERVREAIVELASQPPRR